MSAVHIGNVVQDREPLRYYQLRVSVASAGAVLKVAYNCLTPKDDVTIFEPFGHRYKLIPAHLEKASLQQFHYCKSSYFN